MTFTLRLFEDADADGVIACIRSEYGETYFKRDFYNPAFLRRVHAEDVVTFIVAQTEQGEIAGIIALKSFFPAETMCELASEIFKKEYRGYHLAEPMIRFAMELIAKRSYSAAYALPVTFHSISQRLLQKLGMTATGFIFSVFRTECVQSSYDYGHCQKHAQGIQVMPMEKTDAGVLYLPDEITGIARRIYTKLGVRHEIQSACTPLTGKTRLCFTNDALHGNCSITLLRAGADLKAQVARIFEKYAGQPLQTFNVFVNANDSAAVESFRLLEECGFFFTGFKPLCSDRELFVMHHPNGVEPHTEDYVLTGEFKELLDEIRPFIKVGGFR